MTNLTDQIFHLWKTKHIHFNNGQWENTGNFERAVNNSSNMYYTNDSANKVCNEANEAKLTESVLHSFPAFQYYNNL